MPRKHCESKANTAKAGCHIACRAREFIFSCARDLITRCVGRSIAPPVGWSVHFSISRLIGHLSFSVIMDGFSNIVLPQIFGYPACFFIAPALPPHAIWEAAPPPHAVWEAVYPAFFQVKLNVRKSLNGMERLSEQPS